MANQMDQLYADGRCLKNSILAGTDSGAGLEIGSVRFAQILWLPCRFSWHVISLSLYCAAMRTDLVEVENNKK